jgi:diguanylate cyclase (GGDEF)-like protein/PAS domain S-box-containing protein
MHNQHEANLLALIDSSEDMWGSVDLNYCMLVFNKNFARYIQSCFGVEIRVGMNPADVLPPERAAAWPHLYQRALTHGAFCSEYVLSDGRIYEMSVYPLLDQGMATGVSVYGRDITDRKQAEEKLSASTKALRLSEERYRTAFETNLDAICINRLSDGVFLDANNSFLVSLGCNREDLVGERALDLGIWVDMADRQRLMDALHSESHCRNLVTRFRKKDGGIFWGQLSASLIEVDGAVCILTITRDITASRMNEERYRTVFQTTQDGITISHTNDGHYIDVNKSFLDFTGYEREELIGRSSLDIGIWVDHADRQRLIDLIRNHKSFRDESVQFRKKSGETLWTLVSASEIEIEGEPCLMSVVRDVTEAREAAQKIENLAHYDQLTHLPNRKLLLDRMRQALETSYRSSRKCALLLVDLDNVRTLNDLMGHHVGDQMLQEVARRLSYSVRDMDLVARFGGDEFVVMLEDLNERTEYATEQARVVGSKLLASLAQPCILNGREVLCTCSIGISVCGDQRLEAGVLLQQADIAMDQAKAAGRNTLRFFSPDLQAAVSKRAELEDDLREAIRDQQFLLYYQPQVSHGRVVGTEALIRWRHPRRGVLSPGDFIPIAEETGLILDMGAWVLESACEQIARWSRRTETSHLSVAVNISALQFCQPEFEQHVLDALQRTEADPRRLKLELTESMLVDNIEEIIAKMSSLRSHEISFSLDDFGTGYSSLSYLKRLPLDQLKIDRSFVRDILTDPSSGAIAETIVSLGKTMGMSVIAEGVESEEQRIFLAQLGCHAYQGYLTSRPLPVDDFENLLSARSETATPYVN